MPRTVDPTVLPAHVLAGEIFAGRLSPVELIEATIAKISASDPKLHAFVASYFDDARLAAEVADKAIRSGHTVGPLHGIPIALKDLVELEGRVATGGCMTWQDRLASRTATLARRIVQAGMIVVGKAHTVEFAFGAGKQPAYGNALEPVGSEHASDPRRFQYRVRRSGRGTHRAEIDGHRTEPVPLSLAVHKHSLGGISPTGTGRHSSTGSRVTRGTAAAIRSSGRYQPGGLSHHR